MVRGLCLAPTTFGGVGASRAAESTFLFLLTSCSAAFAFFKAPRVASYSSRVRDVRALPFPILFFFPKKQVQRSGIPVSLPLCMCAPPVATIAVIEAGRACLCL